MKSSLRLLLFFTLISGFSFGQLGEICGTKIPPNAAQIEDQIRANRYLFQGYNKCLNKTLSINLIIVMDSLNKANITQDSIDKGLANLNKMWKPICLSFQICNIDTVWNYNYDKRWNAKKWEKEFKANFVRDNVINILLVENIDDPAGAEGYAPLGIVTPNIPRKDLILIKKKSWTGKTTIHEMGHYFGLYHTFEDQFGKELVDMSNCAVAGDLICDTQADLNPQTVSGLFPTTPPSCTWTGPQKDSKGNLYSPILGNVMSYHPSVCPYSFTTEQYNRMLYCYLTFRNYLM